MYNLKIKFCLIIWYVLSYFFEVGFKKLGNFFDDDILSKILVL